MQRCQVVPEPHPTTVKTVPHPPITDPLPQSPLLFCPIPTFIRPGPQFSTSQCCICTTVLYPVLYPVLSTGRSILPLSRATGYGPSRCSTCPLLRSNITETRSSSRPSCLMVFPEVCVSWIDNALCLSCGGSVPASHWETLICARFSPSERFEKDFPSCASVRFRGVK